MRIIKSIEDFINTDSFKYFTNELKQDNEYEHKFFYYDNKRKNAVLEKSKTLLDDNDIKSISMEISGYSLGIKLWFNKSYSYISKNKKHYEKTMYKNHNEYISINDNKLFSYIDTYTKDGLIFNGLIINIHPFTHGYIYKASYKNLIIYPANRTKYTLIITKNNMFLNIKYEDAKDKKYPLSCNNFLWIINELFKEHRQQLINLIFDFFGETNYLLKDVKKYLLNDDAFFVPLKMNDLTKYHNFNEYFNAKYKKTYNINFNKYDINFNYILMKVYNVFDVNSINKFIVDFKKCFLEQKQLFLKKSFKFSKIYELVYEIINIIYFNNNNSRDFNLYDYIMLCKHNKSKINIKRIKNIKKLHDEEVEKQMKIKEKQLKKMKNNLFLFDNKYEKLINNMPVKYTLIDNEYNLYKEGKYQHNCVYSYKDLILKGKCIIYKYEKNDKKHFTIEIGFYNNIYIIKQIKNTYNAEPEIEDYNEIKSDIVLINSKLKECI